MSLWIGVRDILEAAAHSHQLDCSLLAPLLRLGLGLIWPRIATIFAVFFYVAVVLLSSLGDGRGSEMANICPLLVWKQLVAILFRLGDS